MKYTKFLGAVIGAGLASTVAFTADAAPATYSVVKDTIPQSLTGKAGDPIAGRKAAISRKKGNCLACHVISDIKEQQFHGEVGPELSDVGSNYSAAELRLRVVDPKIVNPDSIMPSFHKVKTNNILKKWKGKTVISAQEVEDIVAYLMTLKGTYSK